MAWRGVSLLVLECCGLTVPIYGVPYRGLAWYTMPLRGMLCHRLACSGLAWYAMTFCGLAVVFYAMPWLGVPCHYVAWPCRSIAWRCVACVGVVACYAMAWRHAMQWFGVE